MSISKEQPQFNMSAVFTSHRGFDDQTGRGVTVTPPVPSSLTPEIDTVVDDVMKWVKSADADSEEEEDDDERDRERNPSLTVNEHVVNNGAERPLHDSFAMGDPPSLLPGVSQFGRTASTPLFHTSSSPVIGLGLGQGISRPTPSRLGTTTETTSGSLAFHFGASGASLTQTSNTTTLGSSPLAVDSIGLFSPPLVPQIEPKPSYPPLGSGFSLTPPPSSSIDPFGSNATMPFNLSPLPSSLSSQSSSPASVTPSSTSSGSPQVQQLLFNHQSPQPQLQPPVQTPAPLQPQPQLPAAAQPQPTQVIQPQVQQQPSQLQPQTQPKLVPPPQQTQPPHHTTTATTNPTHFVGTAAVFVPKSMMAPGAPAPEPASSSPGGYPFHKDFNGYNHPGMFSGVPPTMPNESHGGDVSFNSQSVGGYSIESSTPSQPSNGMNGTNYRTKGCWYFFQTGHCQKGDRCNFSHDRIPGMEIAPPVPNGNMPGMYMQPMPPYGYGVPPDVAPIVGSPRTMAKSNPFVVPPAGTQPQAPPPQQVVQPPQQPTSPPNFVAVQQLYRTKPCRFFFEKGTCLKGDRCNFSHDPAYAAAYAAANPTSGFQMPDMSRFTNTTNGSANSTGTNGNVPNGNGSTNNGNVPNGTNGNGIRGGGGNRHQPSSSSGGGSSLLPTTSNPASRLSSASEVDFPPLG